MERCIYGVDIDPLAVELCRLALWIETMDRTLPFSFLDHKIKAGNSLIGAWFDTYQHYPAMAWKKRDALKRSKEIKTFVKNNLTPDLRDVLSGRLAMFGDATLTEQDIRQERPPPLIDDQGLKHEEGVAGEHGAEDLGCGLDTECKSG